MKTKILSVSILVFLLIPLCAFAQPTEFEGSEVPINQPYHVTFTQRLDSTTPGAVYFPLGRYYMLTIPFSSIGVTSYYDLDEVTAEITSAGVGSTGWVGSRLTYGPGQNPVNVYRNAGGTWVDNSSATDLEAGDGTILLYFKRNCSYIEVQWDFYWTKNGDINLD